MDAPMLVQAANGIFQKHALLDQMTGGRFNIFDITHVTANEVVICRVLYELLSPAGSHFQRDTYLKLFAEHVLELNLSASELANVRVHREYVIDSSRRIDLVIETGERFIPIEVKIYASDQPGQCYDYVQEAKKHMPEPTLYYLTRFGTQPSEHSAHGLSKTDGEYDAIRPISFAVEILNWLNLCVKETNTLKIGPIREVILQFIAAIRQFTSRMEAAVEMELQELLLRSSENMKSAIAIQNSLEQAKTAFLEKLLSAIDARVGRDRLINPYDYAFDGGRQVRRFYRHSASCPGLSYLFKSGIKAGVDIWVRLAIEAGFPYVGYCCPVHQEAGAAQALSEREIRTILKVEPAQTEDWWAYWEFCPSNSEDNSPDFINLNEAYLGLYDEKGFEQFVAACSSRILALLG